MEEEVPNEPPNQEETGSEEGDIPANMDADLEQYLKNRGVCSSTMDALTKHGFTNWSLIQAMESGDPQDMEITTLAQRRNLLKIAAEGPLPAPSPASIAPAAPAGMQGGGLPRTRVPYQGRGQPAGSPWQGHMQPLRVARRRHSTQPPTTPTHHQAAVPGTTAWTHWQRWVTNWPVCLPTLSHPLPSCNCPRPNCLQDPHQVRKWIWTL